MAPYYNSNNGQYDNIGFWPSAATVYSAMANYDHFTGTTTYKTQVTNALNKAFSLYAHYDEVRFATMQDNLPGANLINHSLVTTTMPCGGRLLHTTRTEHTETPIC
jgi:hypothetical protein